MNTTFRTSAKTGLLVFLAAITFGAQAQIIYTNTFTELLQSYGLVYSKPADVWDKVIPLDKDDLFEYDLSLFSEKDGTEIRFIFEPVRSDSIDVVRLSFIRSVVTAATNDQSSEMRFEILSTEKTEAYGAHWAGLGTFQPKTGMADLLRGKWLTLHHTSRGTVHVIVLYNSWTEALDTRLHAMRFE